MATVSVARTYDVPNKSVWKVFADYGNVADFHPGIVESRALNKTKGLGGQRACEFGGGRGVNEEITAWSPGETMTFAATEIRGMPMRKMAGSFHFEGDNPTTVTFVMDYSMKGGPLMDLMARRMMKKAGIGMLDGAEGKF